MPLYKSRVRGVEDYLRFAGKKKKGSKKIKKTNGT